MSNPSDTIPSPIQQQFLNWWQGTGGGAQFQLLFDQLDNIFFFAKDRDSRIIAISEPLARRFAQRLGLKSTADICGLTDHDLHPREIADRFVADDRMVFSTGKPLLSRLEMWYNQDNQLAWSLTTKVPVRDATGGIIGLIGTIKNFNWQESERRESALVSAAVALIHQHHCTAMTIESLAQQLGLSPRHLNRRFREVFSMSVQEFLILQRVQTAKDQLARTTKRISQIAIDSGFYDQSSMTRLFRKYASVTPLQYRKSYQQLSETSQPR